MYYTNQQTGQKRYFLQSRSNTYNYVSKFNINGNHEFISATSYTPNIHNYPISFLSVDSTKDFVTNVFRSQAQAGIAYHISNPVRIVGIPANTTTPVNELLNLYHQECDNAWINNIEEFLKKAAFEHAFVVTFGHHLYNFYKNYTNLDNRKLGSSANIATNYILYKKPGLVSAPDRDSLYSEMSQHNLHPLIYPNVMVFTGQEDYHMAMLAFPELAETHNYIKSGELQSKEYMIPDSGSINYSLFASSSVYC